jgi:hypothetical protein
MYIQVINQKFLVFYIKQIINIIKNFCFYVYIQVKKYSLIYST